MRQAITALVGGPCFMANSMVNEAVLGWDSTANQPTPHILQKWSKKALCNIDGLNDLKRTSLISNGSTWCSVGLISPEPPTSTYQPANPNHQSNSSANQLTSQPVSQPTHHQRCATPRPGNCTCCWLKRRRRIHLKRLPLLRLRNPGKRGHGCIWWLVVVGKARGWYRYSGEFLQNMFLWVASIDTTWFVKMQFNDVMCGNRLNGNK